MGKKIVVPGEVVTEQRKRLGHNVYLHDGRIHSDVLGFVNESDDVASVVPLEGAYAPVEGDLVIGIVTAERFAGYSVDINSFYPSFLNRKDLRDSLKGGNVVSAKVDRVNELNEADLAQSRVFYGGEVIEVSPVKIPRVIGRNGSMLDVLKQGTGCSILVGRNGWIWVKGGDIALLKRALDKISKEAHMENLTNGVTDFLKKEGKSGSAGPAKAEQAKGMPAVDVKEAKEGEKK